MRSRYYRRGEEVHGPFTDVEFRRLPQDGRLQPDDAVTNDEMNFWARAADLTGLEFRDAPEPTEAETTATGADETKPAAAPPKGAQPPAAERKPRAEKKAAKRKDLHVKYGWGGDDPNWSAHYFHPHINWEFAARLVFVGFGLLLVVGPFALWRGCRHAEQEAAATHERDAAVLAARVLGQYLAGIKESGRVLAVVAPKGTTHRNRENEDRLLTGLQQGLGSAISIHETDSPQLPEELREKDDPDSDYVPPLEYWFTTERLAEVVCKHPDCDIVVLLVGLPTDLEKAPRNALDMVRSRTLAVAAGPLAGGRLALRKGEVVAALDLNPAPEEKYPFLSLEEQREFGCSARLVTHENVERLARKYPDLFAR